MVGQYRLFDATKINIVWSFWAEPAEIDWPRGFDNAAEENLREETIKKSNIWENKHMICENCVITKESGKIPFPTNVVVK